MKPRRAAVLLPLVGPACLILLWEIAASGGDVERLFPLPATVFSRAYFLTLNGNLAWDIYATFGRCICGFLLAVSIGTPIGLALGASKALGRAMSVIVDFFRSLPVTAVFPIFLVFFGVGSITMIAMVFFATVFIVIMHATYGIRSTPEERTRMARSFGATGTQIFIHISVIEAIGQVLIGARTALSLSLIVAIVSEMFIGSNLGLGQRLYISYQRQSLADMYAIVLIIGVLGYCANQLFLYLECWIEGR